MDEKEVQEEERKRQRALNRWRLLPVLNVIEAACLMGGIEPVTVGLLRKDGECRAALAALQHAIRSAILPATITSDARLVERSARWIDNPGLGESRGKDNEGHEVVFTDEPDWNKTTLRKEDLKVWLQTMGWASDFFFPAQGAAVSGPGYLDKSHPHYAPKLAAAVKAWEAVEASAEERTGRTVKQRLDKWLREHASEYRLNGEEGKIVESAVVRISQVANWDTEGGAPETPGR